MSAYYHATAAIQSPSSDPCPATGVYASLPAGTMRNWFVGILFAVGAMLYVNKGFSKLENWALNLAGVMTVSIALSPMAWNCKPQNWVSLHGIFAVVFFGCIVVVCEFCSKQTLEWMEDRGLADRFHLAYHGLGALMLLSPICAAAVNFMTDGHSHFIFFAEAFGIWSFSAFWLVKNYELRLIGRQAVRGPVAAEPAAQPMRPAERKTA